jgi:hypothetical protein
MMQWLNTNIFELDFVELYEFQKWLEALDGAIKEKVNKILVKKRKPTQNSVPQTPMEIAYASRY